MSAWHDAADALFSGEGPNGEPPPMYQVAPAPTMTEWMAEHAIVMYWLNLYLLWKGGVVTQPQNVGDEPFDTWEADWPNDDPETMAAKGHVALYP